MLSDDFMPDLCSALHSLGLPASRFAVKIEMMAGRDFEHLRKPSLRTWKARRHAVGSSALGTMAFSLGSLPHKDPGLPYSQKPGESLAEFCTSELTGVPPPQRVNIVF